MKKEKKTGGPLGYLIITAVAGGLLHLGAGEAITGIAGTPPDTVYTPPKATSDSVPRGLENLKSQLDKSPEDIALRMEYISALQQHLLVPAHASEDTVRIFVDEIFEVSRKSADSPDRIREVAMRAFEVKLFEAARQLYEQYLKLRPDDVSARTQYASTLSFLGEQEKAMAELKKNLITHPDHFQTLAFLSIVQAGTGDIDAAIKTGEKALVFAPNDEAKQRLGAFLDKISGKTSPAQGSVINPLEDYLKNHQIAGPKFVSVVAKDSTVHIVFKDFPMIQMPEFARNSFVKSVKEKALLAYPNTKEIIYMDATSHSVMHSDTLSAVPVAQNKTIQSPDPLHAYLADHQIAGSKFVSVEAKDSTVHIEFKDFPMAQMPEFARNSFVKSVKEKALLAYPEAKEIVFMDAVTNSVMHQEKISD